jgi:hypothetical protein
MIGYVAVPVVVANEKPDRAETELATLYSARIIVNFPYRLCANQEAQDL